MSKKQQAQKESQQQETAAQAPQAQGPFVHMIKVFMVGGQEFDMNEVSDSDQPPQNVVAFINAWRERKDVWHSPNNDPGFGILVKDVSAYQYRVGVLQPQAAEEQAQAEQPKAE